MSERVPVVSVCLPVYNGEKFVGMALQSVLGQTLENIELIISDNASTDRTAEICQDAAARDRRVRYSRSQVNVGLARNHNRAFALARGEYAIWMGHDDEMADTYLSRCVERLALEPSAALCFSDSCDIDEHSKALRIVRFEDVCSSPIASVRYSDTVRYESRNDMIYGVIRASVLRQTRLHGAYYGSDWVLLAEIALRGHFCHIPDPLFCRRYHSSQSSKRGRFENVAIFDPQRVGKRNYPFFRLAAGFAVAPFRAPVPLRERCSSLRHFMHWCSRHRHYLREDVEVNARGVCDAVRSLKRRFV